MLPASKKRRRNLDYTIRRRKNHPNMHQQNVKTSPGSPKRVMVSLVLLVHPDPPWSTFSVKFQKVWIRMDWSAPGAPRGPQPPLVDQEHSGPPWTTLRHFPDPWNNWAAFKKVTTKSIWGNRWQRRSKDATHEQETRQTISHRILERIPCGGKRSRYGRLDRGRTTPIGNEHRTPNCVGNQREHIRERGHPSPMGNPDSNQAVNGQTLPRINKEHPTRN